MTCCIFLYIINLKGDEQREQKKPPFEINIKIMNTVIDIAALVGKVSVSNIILSNPALIRTNRIRTIYSTLAIEQNTLNIDQVTAVISGKRVIVPPKGHCRG